MKLEACARVLVRLFAIYLVIEAIVLVPGMLGFAASVSYMGSESGASIAIASYLAVPVGYLLCSVVLWVWADRIAGHLGADDGEIDGAPVTADQLECVGLALLGAYLVAVSLPELVRFAVLHWSSPHEYAALRPPIDPLEVMVTSVTLCIGLALLLGARGLQSLLNRARYHGR